MQVLIFVDDVLIQILNDHVVLAKGFKRDSSILIRDLDGLVFLKVLKQDMLCPKAIDLVLSESIENALNILTASLSPRLDDVCHDVDLLFKIASEHFKRFLLATPV
jgi:hypothetical protein